jgi:hypothetical protein
VGAAARLLRAVPDDYLPARATTVEPTAPDGTSIPNLHVSAHHRAHHRANCHAHGRTHARAKCCADGGANL